MTFPWEERDKSRLQTRPFLCSSEFTVWSFRSSPNSYISREEGRSRRTHCTRRRKTSLIITLSLSLDLCGGKKFFSPLHLNRNPDSRSSFYIKSFSLFVREEKTFLSLFPWNKDSNVKCIFSIFFSLVFRNFSPMRQIFICDRFRGVQRENIDVKSQLTITKP